MTISTAPATAKPAHRNQRPLAVRLLNAAGKLLANDGRLFVPLDPDRLMARAERSTGLRDWGEADIRPALRVLADSLNQESQLNTIGRLMLLAYIDRILCNRLNVRNTLKQHPEILEVPVRRPVFIVGLPRTGSTLLQRLLARDPQVRSLHAWEMMFPTPPPEEATYTSDRRIRDAARRLNTLNWSAPEFATAHEVEAGEPEECVSLLQATFTSPAFELMANMPSYSRWVGQQDLHGAYLAYREQLQLLQWRYRKDHWVLKSPFHLFGLEALMDTFPDAVIVQTHREPTQVIPSLCSLFSVMHALTSDSADPMALGPVLLKRLAQANENPIRLREQRGADRFVDIGYRELVQDPVAAAAKIYERTGTPLTREAAEAMRSWHAGSPQHKHGVHRYTLEQFGLDKAQVSTRFGPYTERFGQFF